MPVGHCAPEAAPTRSAARRAGVRAAIAAALLAFAPLLGCGAGAQQGADTSVAPDTGWLTLFDGAGLSAWRGFRAAEPPAGWRVEDGTLAFVPGAGGGDLVTREQFDHFELELDWRVSPGGNSGIFFRVTENFDHTWASGPEMQVLDDAAHRDGQDPLTSAGSNYALHPAPRGVVRPAGEWNRVRLRVHGNRVEHWLNGTRVVEYELGSDDWERRVAASKFAGMPGYGRSPRGHIALQDHGDRVWFRDIRVRRLPAPD